VGDFVVVYCVVDVMPGEDLLHSYLSVFDYEERRWSLTKWGIDCNCLMCREQRKEFASKRMKTNLNQRLVTFSRAVFFEKQSVYYKRLQEDDDWQSMASISMHPFNDIGVAAKM
jgi:hypothetical protein